MQENTNVWSNLLLGRYLRKRMLLWKALLDHRVDYKWYRYKRLRLCYNGQMVVHMDRRFLHIPLVAKQIGIPHGLLSVITSTLRKLNVIVVRINSLLSMLLQWYKYLFDIIHLSVPFEQSLILKHDIGWNISRWTFEILYLSFVGKWILEKIQSWLTCSFVGPISIFYINLFFSIGNQMTHWWNVEWRWHWNEKFVFCLNDTIQQFSYKNPIENNFEVFINFSGEFCKWKIEKGCPPKIYLPQ